jgi:hypothetical protein
VPKGDNSDGAVGVALLEGDYQVTVRPPAGVRMAAMHSGFLRVARPSPEEYVQRGQLFELGPRAELHGTVLDLGHRPVGALPLEAHLLEATGDGAGADLTNLNRTATGYTDPDGAFELFVEPGIHYVLFEPADDSQYPWRIVSNVHAPNGPVDVSLEAPIVLSGVVTIGGTPLSGVDIEALVRNDAFGATIGVAEAASDASGKFRLLLSPSIGTL